MIKTSCKNCIFATVENSKQTGCKLKRHEKLGIDSQSPDGYFSLSRFCNTYRPKDWLKHLSLDESINLTDTVLNEVKPNVGFFIIFNGDTKGCVSEKLKPTIDCLKNQDIPPKYVAVINNKVEYNEDIHELLISSFDEEQTYTHVVQMLYQPEILEAVIDEAFTHAKNGWAYVCNAGEDIDKNLITKIHKRINLDMKQLVVIEPYEGTLNGLLFQAALFKFLNGNGVKVFQDTSVDNRRFLDKVKDYASNSGKDTFITWKDFYEQT